MFTTLFFGKLGTWLLGIGFAGTAAGVMLFEPEGIALRIVQGFYILCIVGSILAGGALLVEMSSL